MGAKHNDEDDFACEESLELQDSSDSSDTPTPAQKKAKRESQEREAAQVGDASTSKHKSTASPDSW